MRGEILNGSGGRKGIGRCSPEPFMQTLRVTPAMQAGLTDHIWILGELLD